MSLERDTRGELDFLEAAASHSVNVAPKSYTQRILDIQKSIQDLKRASKGSLKFEEEDVEAAKYEIRQLENFDLHKFKILEKATKAKYRLMSEEPLNWRREDGWPRLAIFSLQKEDDKTCEIALYESGRLDFIHPRYGMDDFLKHYNDLKPKLREKLNFTRAVSITCRFKGLFDSGTRTKIREAQKIFGEDYVFLIAEPKEWTVKQYPRDPIGSVKDDPLVVGYESDSKSLWLIHSFNTTFVEDLAGSWKKGIPDPHTPGLTE